KRWLEQRWQSGIETTSCCGRESVPSSPFQIHMRIKCQHIIQACPNRASYRYVSTLTLGGWLRLHFFEFHTRRKPFCAKANRPNGVGSNNGGAYHDSKNDAGTGSKHRAF